VIADSRDRRDHGDLPLPSIERRSRDRQPLAPKVPEISAVFWIIKILTTGMGEATSDFLGNVSIALAAGVGLLGLGFALWLQFRVRRYIAPVYWLAVVMVAIVGTGAADILHGQAHIPYIGSTALYATAVGVVFYRWYRSEGTLSIHSIVTRRRETYYWITVFATFALGTAAGDMTASTMHLGFLASGISFGVIILIPAIGYWRYNLNPVVAFWFAYVLTRPLGASFADWFGKPRTSGLGLGDGTVSAAATIAIIVLVGFVFATKRDIQSGTEFPAMPIASGDDDSFDADDDEQVA
jgi:uncharacterized membrane-anchored protein